MRSQVESILDETRSLLRVLDEQAVENLYRELMNAPRVLAYATGRSGFVLRTFVMRLNHVGQEAYYVGEASTPPVRGGDVLLVMSGSGTTATTLGAASEARQLGARVVALVGSRNSPIAHLAETVVELPAPHKRGIAAIGVKPGSPASVRIGSVQPAGSLFEQACFVLLESVILRRFNEIGHQPGSPLTRHANLEA